jgi:peptide/nickel transport system permease protein
VTYLARRLAYGLLVIVLVATTVFVVTRLFADPAASILGAEATAESYAQLRHDLGLDRSIPVQYARYVKDAVTFDFGVSNWQGTSVTGLIKDRLPNTIRLVGIAMVFAIVIGILLGITASRRPGSKLDQGVAGFALLGLCLPQFWLGAVLILIGAVQLGWFPSFGIGGVDHLILPALTLALPALGRVAQITRTAMIDELSSQHILTARAKGLSEPYIIVRHALRNVLVPILTICSWELIVALAGYSIVVETVFAWPGIGQLTIQAIQQSDLTLVQGIVMVIALIVVLVNLLTDLAYKLIDPRIELG